MFLFLFAKQLVDMLYRFQWLDYLMVLSVLFMLGYQLLLTHASVKNLLFPDMVVIGLSLFAVWGLVGGSIEDGYETFCKVLSAYLMYFVGRVYCERIEECYPALVASSYIVVYANFFYRLYRHGGRLVMQGDNSGELFFYKTDMAYAVLLSTVFICLLGRSFLGKLVTAVFICPYMVLCSGARTQWVLLFAVYFVFGYYLWKKRLKRHRLTRKDMLSYCGLLLGVVLMLAAFSWVTGIERYLRELLAEFAASENGIPNSIGHSRQYIWSNILHTLASQPLFRQIFGRGWGLLVEVAADGHARDAHSTYFRVLLATGYAGFALFLFFLLLVLYYMLHLKEERFRCMVISVLLIFCGSGLTISAIIFTQMSWFPMMFAGMAVTKAKGVGNTGGENRG